MKYTLANPQWIHHIGKRGNQEDNLYPYEDEVKANDRIFIVCDGMGGHDSGEVASKTVCDELSQWLVNNFDTDDVLTAEKFSRALSAAYDGLDAKDNPDVVKKMGTTLTFVAFHAGGVTMAHIGDSRIYHVRPETKEILYKSRDHSLVNDLIAIGEMTEEEARTSPNKNVITRAMQPSQPRRSKAEFKTTTDVKAGDYFYMCTDGMLEQMEDQELLYILSSDIPDEEKKQILLDKTEENRDNHTAFLIRVTDVTGEALIPASMANDQTEAPNLTSAPKVIKTANAAPATATAANAATTPREANPRPAAQQARPVAAGKAPQKTAHKSPVGKYILTAIAAAVVSGAALYFLNRTNNSTSKTGLNEDLMEQIENQTQNQNQANHGNSQNQANNGNKPNQPNKPNNQGATTASSNQSQPAQAQKPNVTYSNGVLTVDGVTYKMISVVEGTFTMGSNDGEEIERPAHVVELSDFRMGETEVTKELWKKVMGTDPSSETNKTQFVDSVSWENCAQFINELNKLTGKQFRLPREAEWEYVARGGKPSATAQHSGSIGQNLLTQAHVLVQEASQGKDSEPKSLDIKGMDNGFKEWCFDRYGNYSKEKLTDPKGATSGELRVFRGGPGSSYCKRYYNTPDYKEIKLGFRLAISE